MTVAFDSCKDYFSFVMARGYYDTNQQQILSYPQNLLEKLGAVILAPTFLPTDQLLQNIKNPLVITCLTIAAIAIVTIAFYPATFMGVVGTVLPFIWHIQPWMLKLALFGAVELSILAVGLRALGRMTNPHLIDAWNKKDVVAIQIGTKI